MRSPVMRRPSTASIRTSAPSTRTTSPASGRRPSASKASPASVRGPSCGSDAPTSSLKSSIVIEPATRTVCSSTRVELRGRQVELVLDLAHDLLEHVVHGHDPGRAAVLVDHDRDLLALLAQLAQQRAEVLGHRHDRAPGRASEPTVGVGRGQQVAQVHDADQVVERLARRPGSARAGSRSRRRAPARAVSDASSHATSGAGTITSRDLAGGEVEHVVQELLLRARDHARALGLVDQRAQLLGVNAPSRPPSPR